MKPLSERPAASSDKKYYQGVECGTYREYSDQLLALLLRARRPERYRESSTVKHTGPDGGAVQSSIEIRFVSPSNDSGVSGEA
jgi:hypothetical protein